MTVQSLVTSLLKCPKSFPFKKLLGVTKFKVDAKLDSFLSGNSAQYVELMYKQWLKDPNSVHPSWDAYFRLSEKGGAGYTSPPTLGRTKQDMPLSKAGNPGPQTNPAKPPAAAPAPSTAAAAAPATQASAGAATNTDIEKHLAVFSLIRGFQVRGHFFAKIDPLDRPPAHGILPVKSGVAPKVIFPFTSINDGDLNKVFQLPHATSIGGKEKSLPLKEIIKRLEDAYCRSIGLEYMYINSIDECNWIRDRFEPPGITSISNDKKKLCLSRLARAHLFENFCARKHASIKRFGIEGLEVTIPAIKSIIDKSSELGVETFVIGMAHRGRLNVLVNICDKPLVKTLALFQGLKPEEAGTGDVKYHLGAFAQKLNKVTKKNVKVILVANPSHLESVNPVAVGRVRAEQFFGADLEGKKCLAILLHGDAAFTGQGVNFEVINIASLPCYTTHGTIHIVTNNQVGFTTDRILAGSSPYCTDVGRVINSPIIHVNGDDPDAVVYVSEVASDWRQKFRRDIIIDIVGYRKHGHQEVDDPLFTQPVLYNKKIKLMKPCYEKYAEKLVNEKIVTAAEVKQIQDDYEKLINADFEKVKDEKTFRMKDWLDAPWDEFFKGKDPNKMLFPTGVTEDIAAHIAKAVSLEPPESTKFVIHKVLQRVLKGRADLAKNRQIDFAMAEAIAYGSLLKQGIPVRITGEDVERGTFNHRHHIYHHQNVENEKYCPIRNLYPKQAVYTICNSSLSEYSIMGFEHGYSLTNPHALVIWEAQFGDFSNTAQPIIDQFLSSGESKWGRQCGMVCLMPHGMEGQGPEHSSVRPERFGDMTCEDAEVMPKEDAPNYVLDQLRNINWIVVNCSVPSNHFHALRRQVALPFRKPLIMLTPKGILRLPEARSSFDHILEGTEFQRLIPDAGPASSNAGEVKKLIFCIGKVYYDAAKAVKAKKMEAEIAVSRIEQIAPFPFDLAKKELEKYKQATVHFLQEEHKNQGFWDHVDPRLRTILRSMNDRRRVSYIGRVVSASPATGYKYQYDEQYNKMLADITSLEQSDSGGTSEDSSEDGEKGKEKEVDCMK
ncbi:unnamed protein product [Phyllotreta striolata]|uniref:2-oxoglutarate dehydrogenase, mitochondrial n=1 Tax=Phyllotreta striolata TaxID=444603 RepID=A0A9N9XNT5_PHYSR|nr:unnamed protein product [Phyllotreta striolata]